VHDDEYVVGISFKKRSELQDSAAVPAEEGGEQFKLVSESVLWMNASDELVLAPMGLFFPDAFQLSSGLASDSGGHNGSGGDGVAADINGSGSDGVAADIGRVRSMRSHAWIDNNPSVWKTYGIDFDDPEDCFDREFLAGTAKADEKSTKDVTKSTKDAKDVKDAKGAVSNGAAGSGTAGAVGGGQSQNGQDDAVDGQASSTQAAADSMAVGGGILGKKGASGDVSGRWALSQSKLLPGGVQQQDEVFGPTPLLGLHHAVCLSLTRVRQEIRQEVRTVCT
jgi:hypothetical protein